MVRYAAMCRLYRGLNNEEFYNFLHRKLTNNVTAKLTLPKTLEEAIYMINELIDNLHSENGTLFYRYRLAGILFTAHHIFKHRRRSPYKLDIWKAWLLRYAKCSLPCYYKLTSVYYCITKYPRFIRLNISYHEFLKMQPNIKKMLTEYGEYWQ